MDSITMPVLQVLLLAIMFLAILVEVKTGGTGTGIMFGLVAAVVFWGSQYVKGRPTSSRLGSSSAASSASSSRCCCRLSDSWPASAWRPCSTAS